MKIFLCFFSLLFLVSCIDKNQPEKPKDLIPKDTMTSLLVDMLLASTSKNSKNKNLESKVNYMPLIFDKYKIDSLRFQSSNLYYTSLISEQENIYKEVKKRLEFLQKKYTKLKEVKDSIRKDSMLKQKEKFVEKLEDKKRIFTSKKKDTGLKLE